VHAHAGRFADDPALLMMAREPKEPVPEEGSAFANLAGFELAKPLAR
jgi:hypothetical protein